MNESTGVPACEALKNSGLGERLLFATDSGYEYRVQTWWSLNTRLRPYCFVLPQSTQEVSTALTALVNANDGAGDWHIAVRSGTHASIPINNIDRGVTIDLSYLNSTSYNAETNIASVGPGGKWNATYAEPQNYGVTVVGGRDGGVGVGGFLIGGGISYYTTREGWGCDTVVNFEVVLANGAIVNASSTNNSDLFDMEAITSTTLYQETRLLSSNYSDQVVNFVSEFTDLPSSDADEAIYALYTYSPTYSPDIFENIVHVNTRGNVNTSAPFNKLKSLPHMSYTSGVTNMAEAANSSQTAGGSRGFGWTVTFRNDPKIISRVVQLHADYVSTLKQLIDPDAFETLMFLEPLPSYTKDITKQKGGNMLGIDNVEDNAILVVFGVAVATRDADGAIAQAEVNKMLAQVEKASKSLNGALDLVYMNYADASQNPLGSYGQANVQYIRNVAERYDPNGVFQERIPRVFKIWRAG